MSFLSIITEIGILVSIEPTGKLKLKGLSKLTIQQKKCKSLIMRESTNLRS